VFGLIYIFVIAKPISIRRLSLLFGVTLITTDCLFGITHIQNSRSVALATAAALTILAWLAPFVTAVGASVKARRLTLNALDAASRVVQITYGSALAILLLTAFHAVVEPLHPLTLDMLLKTWVVGGVAGVALFAGIRNFSQWHEPVPQKTEKGFPRYGSSILRSSKKREIRSSSRNNESSFGS
jgi:hypothetical protein